MLKRGSFSGGSGKSNDSGAGERECELFADAKGRVEALAWASRNFRDVGLTGEIVRSF